MQTPEKIDKRARQKSRLLAVKTFFYFIEREETIPLNKCFNYVLKEIDERKSDAYAKQLINKANENKKQIEVIIKSLAPDLEFKKIAPINRTILSIAITEMKHFDTPPVVVINEYIELAKTFGEAKSASFVNAVLDEFQKNLTPAQN